MTVCQWLGRARNISREVDMLERSRREEYERVTSIASQLSGSAGTTSSPNPHKFDKLIEYDELLGRRVEELLGVKAEIEEQISRLKDSRCRMLLHMRYVDCREWNEIRRNMHYSESNIYKLRKKAIADLAKILICNKAEWPDL